MQSLVITTLPRSPLKLEKNLQGYLDVKGETKRKTIEAIVQRMSDLGWDLSELNREYCQLRQQKGDEGAIPSNRRQMLINAINPDKNPTLETILDIVETLGGTIAIEWTDKRLVKIEPDRNTEDNAQKS